MVILDHKLTLRRARLLEGVTVVEQDLQIDYGANAMFEQPTRIRPAGSFTLPDRGRFGHAEVPNRGLQIIRAGAFDRMLGEIDASRKKQQNGADQLSHAQSATLLSYPNRLTPLVSLHSKIAESGDRAAPRASEVFAAAAGVVR